MRLVHAADLNEHAATHTYGSRHRDVLRLSASVAFPPPHQCSARPPGNPCPRRIGATTGSVAARAALVTPLWWLENHPSASRGALVGMVEPAEDGHGAYRSRTANRLPRRRCRERLLETLVRPRPVEVRDVFPEHAGQLPLAQDQDVVQALAADAAQEALAHGMCPRRAVRRARDADATACGDGRACRPVRALVVAAEEPGALVERLAARRCRATRASVGWRVTPTCTTRRAPSAITKQAHNGRQARSVTGRKSQARIVAAWLRRKVDQAGPRGRGVPAQRRAVCIVRFATRTPSVPSSPRIRSAPPVSCWTPSAGPGRRTRVGAAVGPAPGATAAASAPGTKRGASAAGSRAG